MFGVGCLVLSVLGVLVWGFGPHPNLVLGVWCSVFGVRCLVLSVFGVLVLCVWC